MRRTVSGVAVCMFVGLGLLSLWQERGMTAGASRVAAQEKQESQGRRQKVEAQGSAEPTIGSNNASTEAKLAKRLPAEYPGGIPVQDILNDVAERFAVQIFVDQRALQDAAIDLRGQPSAVELNLKSVRGDMLLDLVLAGVGLEYTIRDGIVLITTPEDLAGTLELRVYNCRDLVAAASSTGPFPMGSGMMPGMMGGMGGMMPGAAPSDSGLPGSSGGAPAEAVFGAAPQPGGFPGEGAATAPGGMPGSGAGTTGMGMPGMPGMGMGFGGGGLGMAGTSGSAQELGNLIQVIITTVLPESWHEAGGPGRVEAFYPGLLVVNTNPQVHREIEKLLTMLRDANKQQPGAVIREK